MQRKAENGEGRVDCGWMCAFVVGCKLAGQLHLMSQLGIAIPDWFPKILD